MKKLIALIIAFPLLASAELYYYPGTVAAEWNATHPTPCCMFEKNLTFGGTIIPQQKTEQQLYKELYIALLKLKVELLRLQIAALK